MPKLRSSSVLGIFCLSPDCRWWTVTIQLCNDISIFLARQHADRRLAVPSVCLSSVGTVSKCTYTHRHTFWRSGRGINHSSFWAPPLQNSNGNPLSGDTKYTGEKILHFSTKIAFYLGNGMTWWVKYFRWIFVITLVPFDVEWRYLANDTCGEGHISTRTPNRKGAVPQRPRDYFGPPKWAHKVWETAVKFCMVIKLYNRCERKFFQGRQWPSPGQNFWWHECWPRDLLFIIYCCACFLYVSDCLTSVLTYELCIMLLCPRP